MLPDVERLRGFVALADDPRGLSEAELFAIASDGLADMEFAGGIQDAVIVEVEVVGPDSSPTGRWGIVVHGYGTRPGERHAA